MTKRDQEQARVLVKPEVFLLKFIALFLLFIVVFAGVLRGRHYQVFCLMIEYPRPLGTMLFFFLTKGEKNEKSDLAAAGLLGGQMLIKH